MFVRLMSSFGSALPRARCGRGRERRQRLGGLPRRRISDILAVEQPYRLESVLFMGLGMRIFTPVASRALGAALAVLGAAAVAGCAGDTNPVRDVAVATGLGPKITPAPDFVVQSRPAKLDYIPVGTSAPGRSTPARSVQDVKAAEAELAQARATNEAAAAAAQGAGAAATAPAPAKPRPRAANTP